MNLRMSRTLGAAALLALTACSSTTLLPPSKVDAVVADQWQAVLPHYGSVGGLSDWWKQQGDPVLVDLIDAAQSASPTVANALARIEDARSKQAQAYGALVPNLSAQASAQRGISQPSVPLATTLQAGVQASWELDLVGANRAANDAATAQIEGSRAQWHDARVSVAAEVANLYYNHANCLQVLDLGLKNVASQRETARLVEINANAGMAAPSDAGLARAAAAEGNSRLMQQGAVCDINVKALVALTTIPEPALRQKLSAMQNQPVAAQPLTVTAVPAQTIAQRPDVFAAERDVVVAAAAVGNARSKSYPRLSLNGSIGVMRVGNGGFDQNETTWSFGPLALSLPLYDGGQRAASTKAAEAAYQASISGYQGKVRQAVREVEEALINLYSCDAREGDAQTAIQGYDGLQKATQTRYDRGLASLVELEDARRQALSARTSLANLQLQRNQAWVALYRALGGGFEPSQAIAPATAHAN
jgi:NodT family efflux transporter outer membrane factor (OMF) lipoprotein